MFATDGQCVQALEFATSGRESGRIVRQALVAALRKRALHGTVSRTWSRIMPDIFGGMHAAASDRLAGPSRLASSDRHREAHSIFRNP
jgi:hypothetical protein